MKIHGEDIVHAFMKILDKCTGEVEGSSPFDCANKKRADIMSGLFFISPLILQKSFETF